MLKIFLTVTEVEIWFNRFPKSLITENINTIYQTCYSFIRKILIEEFLFDFLSSFDNLNIIINLLILVGNVEIAITNVANSAIFDQILTFEETEKDILLNKLFDSILAVN